MAKNKTYQEKKEAAEMNLSYGELADAQAHFENLGRRYGLLQEFRENAII